MAIWVKDLNKDNFKVCFRETKILDGLHKDIRMVRESFQPQYSIIDLCALTILILKRPQDAMAIWVKDLNKDNFKVCFRETKILDGLHKDIRMVRESFQPQYSIIDLCALTILISYLSSSSSHQYRFIL